jgi:hypothetical protein
MSAMPNTRAFTLLLSLFTLTDPIICEYLQCSLNSVKTAFCVLRGIICSESQFFLRPLCFCPISCTYLVFLRLLCFCHIPVLISSFYGLSACALILYLPRLSTASLLLPYSCTYLVFLRPLYLCPISCTYLVYIKILYSSYVSHTWPDITPPVITSNILNVYTDNRLRPYFILQVKCFICVRL